MGSDTVTQLVRRPATYAGIEALPPNLVGEIIDGELVSHPRPTPRRAAASLGLADKIVGPFQKGRGGGPGGWVFMVEPELHFGTQVVVPDLAGWRRERLTALPDTACLEIAPDWVCGVISPSTERYDRRAKRRIYATAGVARLWLLDPRGKLLETFVLATGNWMLSGTFQGADEVSAPPFDAITFSLGALWPFDTGDEPSPSAEA